MYELAIDEGIDRGNYKSAAGFQYPEASDDYIL